MDDLLGAIAFLGLIAAQLAAVVAVHRMRVDKEAAPSGDKFPEIAEDARARDTTRHFWLSQ